MPRIKFHCESFLFLFICIVITSTNQHNCPETEGCQRLQSHIQNETHNEIICRRVIDVEFSIDVHVIHLCKYDNATFYLKHVIKKLPNVRQVIIFDSKLSYLIGPNRYNHINLLRINNSTLKRVADNLLHNMSQLHVLDLRNNSFDRLPNQFTQYPGLQLKDVYLSNNKWNCRPENLMWTRNITTSLIRDLETVDCDDPFNGKPVFHISKFQQDIMSECPRYCDCELFNIVRDFEDVLNPIIAVKCLNQGLLQLPRHLPNLTKILHLENNSISDLSPIVTNRSYKDLLELYLDHNNIASIAILEGGDWLQRFNVLSLRSNKLVQLPTYALDNALSRNENMPDAVLFYLADNPWRCDCAYTPHFQEMLMKYAPQIKDLHEVRCRFAVGDENSLLPIVSLTRNSICRQANDYAIKPLDLVNIILASLIVLVLGKLVYDYYFFKKTGRLPWIVSKMP